jgi:hypothetical protein
MSTVALGTTAPEGSETVPVTEVELPPDCAYVLKQSANKRKTAEAAKSDFL